MVDPHYRLYGQDFNVLAAAGTLTDLDTVLARLNALEEYAGLEASTWREAYGAPSDLGLFHLALDHPTLGATYLPEAVDFARDAAGGPAWTWNVYKPGGADQQPRNLASDRGNLELLQAIGRAYTPTQAYGLVEIPETGSPTHTYPEAAAGLSSLIRNTRALIQGPWLGYWTRSALSGSWTAWTKTGQSGGTDLSVDVFKYGDFVYRRVTGSRAESLLEAAAGAVRVDYLDYTPPAADTRDATTSEDTRVRRYFVSSGGSHTETPDIDTDTSDTIPQDLAPVLLAGASAPTTYAALAAGLPAEENTGADFFWFWTDTDPAVWLAANEPGAQHTADSQALFDDYTNDTPDTSGANDAIPGGDAQLLLSSETDYRADLYLETPTPAPFTVRTWHRFDSFYLPEDWPNDAFTKESIP